MGMCALQTRTDADTVIIGMRGEESIARAQPLLRMTNDRPNALYCLRKLVCLSAAWTTVAAARRRSGDSLYSASVSAPFLDSLALIEGDFSLVTSSID